MMTKNSSPLCKIKFLSCFLLLLLFSYPLGVLAAEEVDESDRTVKEGFENSDRQVSVEPEESEFVEPIEEAEEIQPENELDGLMENQSLFGMFVQLFLALAVIILMIYALIRFIGKRSQSYQANRTLQNIGGVHIGTNRSIQLVRVGERVLVVGVGETIQLLKEIDNQEEVTTILNDFQIQGGQQQLSSMFNKLQTKLSDQKDGTDKSKVYFKNLLDRQLTDVKNAQRDAHTAIKEKEQ